jgi:hypothetical protein
MSHHEALLKLFKDKKVITWAIGGNLGNFGVSVIFDDSKGTTDPTSETAKLIMDEIVKAVVVIVKTEQLPWAFLHSNETEDFHFHVYPVVNLLELKQDEKKEDTLEARLEASFDAIVNMKND